MYLAFFGLAEKPFAITPDPRYLYPERAARRCARAPGLRHQRGRRLHPADRRGRYRQDHDHPLAAGARAEERRDRADPQSAAVAERVPAGAVRGAGHGRGRQRRRATTKELVDLLNRYLLRAHAQGRRVVLIVDEAQNLAPEVLEQIRLLTNLETETQKLLQIILIGQPELRKLLAREDLRQLAQRITGRYHLDPLSRQETAAYVRHRMRVAGATADIFTRGALREIYRVSRGIPRVINIICDRALLGAYTQDLHQVPGLAGAPRRAPKCSTRTCRRAGCRC